MNISNILTPEHRAADLWLEEDEDIVTLGMGDKVVARFGHYAEIEHIWHEATQALEWENAKKSGISFERSG